MSSHGIKPDPQKVEAINAMPTPANREDSQRSLGVVTYLLKFIPNMSQKMNGLGKKLMQLQALRKHQSSAPVLKFFDSMERVTMSVNAMFQRFGCCYSPERLPCGLRLKSPNSEPAKLRANRK